MPKHIAGNPAMIVDNMGGAGSRLAANYLFKASAPDGLTIGNFIGSLLLQQILGDQGVEFDGKRFEWLGAPVQDENGLRADQSERRHQPRPMVRGQEAGETRRRSARRQRLRRAAHVASDFEAADAIDRRLQRHFDSFASPPKPAKSTAAAGPGRRSARLGKRASTRGKSFRSFRSTRRRPHDIPNVPNAYRPRQDRRSAKRCWKPASTRRRRSCAPTRCRPARRKTV